MALLFNFTPFSLLSSAPSSASGLTVNPCKYTSHLQKPYRTSIENLSLESKLQLKIEQKMRMKMAKKIRLRRKRIVRKRHLRKKGRWPPSKLKKNKNV